MAELPTLTGVDAEPELSFAEHVCLALVVEEPRHGWSIVKALEPSSELGRIWTLHRALTYRAIDHLVSEGLLERRDGGAVRGPNRVELLATSDGVRVTERWLDAPVDRVRDLRTEFVLKVTLRRRRGLDLGPFLDAQEAALVPHLEAQAADRGDDSTLGLWRRESARATHRFLGELRASLLDPTRSPADGGADPVTGDVDELPTADDARLALAPHAAAAATDPRAVLARTIDLRGFGSERPGEVLLVVGERAVGRLLRGVLDDRLVAEAAALVATDRACTVAGCTVTGVAADAADLTCGGTASVLLQRLDTVPHLFWPDGRGVPRVTFTRLTGDDAGATLTVTQDGRHHGTLGDADADERAVEVAGGQMRWGAGGVGLIDDAQGRLVMDVSWASRRLLVVGAGPLADALCRVGAGLGWSVAPTRSTTDAVADLAGATPADAVVVLSHDPAVDVPVLAAALAGETGYVAALGSRQTQSSRRDRLRSAGVTSEAIARLRGPAGLDLGATGPGEIAVSIAAEIIAGRSDRDARPLSESAGPIHHRFGTT